MRRVVVTGVGGVCALGSSWPEIMRGLKACRPATLRHDAALDLVHRQDRAVLHHVVHILSQQHVGVQRVLHSGMRRKVRGVEEVRDPE